MARGQGCTKEAKQHLRSHRAQWKPPPLLPPPGGWPPVLRAADSPGRPVAPPRSLTAAGSLLSCWWARGLRVSHHQSGGKYNHARVLVCGCHLPGWGGMGWGRGGGAFNPSQTATASVIRQFFTRPELHTRAIALQLKSTSSRALMGTITKTR